MSITINKNIKLVETNENSIFLLNNIFDTVYSYIYAQGGNPEYTNLNLYCLLQALKNGFEE